jgi:anti-anti-sigma factor
MVIRGTLDELNADQLRRAVTDILREQRPQRINLDLRGVTDLDAAGISALRDGKVDATRAASELEITNASDRAYHVLRMHGLCDYFGLTQPQLIREPGE